MGNFGPQWDSAARVAGRQDYEGKHNVARINHLQPGIALILLTVIGAVRAQAPLPKDDQEFTDHDFQQFFGLLEDGEITVEKMEQRCVKEQVGFTFTGSALKHSGEMQRIDYNDTGLEMSVEGRPLRSKYKNATTGEWTGAVFKPLCPGLYSVSVDFSATLPKRSDPGDMSLHIFMNREGDIRPGLKVLTTHPGGTPEAAAGHAQVVLALATGDEVSTWTEMTGRKTEHELNSVSISVFKITHLPELTKAFSMEGWAADLEATGFSVGGAPLEVGSE